MLFIISIRDLRKVIHLKGRLLSLCIYKWEYDMQHNSYRRWITLAIISFSGGVSFDLAYLRYIYQIPIAKFMGFSNTEIGLIMSTFGIAAIILYAPSGVIADKFSHRKMITSAMIITGLLGLLMATYPPLWVMLCIQVAFAITTILMLWSVSIKAASLLGDHSEQGKIMGWMEGLRGVGVMSLAVFTMWVFSRFAPDDSASLENGHNYLQCGLHLVGDSVLVFC